MAEKVSRKGDVSGMTKVFTKNGWRKAFFWLLIIILAFLTIRDVYNLFKQYAEGEKEADMTFVFNTSIVMPNFTFCIPMAMVNSIYNSSKFKTKADLGGKVSDEEAVRKTLGTLETKEAFLSKQWDRHTIHNANKVIGILHSLERETDDSFVAREIDLLKRKNKEELKSINFWLQQIQKRNVTFGEFMQKAGSEVLRRMIKRSHRISPLEETKYESGLKITWISDGDICFQPTFDKKANYDIKAPGNFYNLLLHHDPETFEDDIHCMIVDMNGRPADMGRFIDSGGHTKDGVNEELCPGTQNDLIVEISATYTMLENKGKGTACMDFEDDEDSSEFNCKSRCRMNLIRSICSCSPITIADLIEPEDEKEFPLCDYSKCKVDVQTAANSEKSCTRSCRRSCKQIRYTINLVGSKESTTKAGQSDNSTKAMHQTQVNLAWGSFEYFQLEQNYKWTSIENFFADVGGAIGIWLGLSILSLIQGAGYIAELTAGRCTSQQSEDNETPEEAEDRKFSANPLGPPTLAANPLGDIAAPPPRKRSTMSGNQ